MKWKQIQEGVDKCEECYRIGANLFISKEDCLKDKPKRPPEPKSRPILFVSEAPPKPQSGGGFWDIYSKDNLRENLFEILNDCSDLTTFLKKGFFLVQAIKWPSAKDSYANKGVKDIINHTVKSHLGPEIEVLQPKAIICLGTIACRSISSYFKGRSIFETTDTKIKINEICSKDYKASIFGYETRIYPTYLPVHRNKRFFELIKTQINKAIK